MDVSIIIVNYNTRKLLWNCLRSVASETSGLLYQLFVVDNASADGSVEMLRSNFPSVTVIAKPDNPWVRRGEQPRYRGIAGALRSVVEQRYSCA